MTASQQPDPEAPDRYPHDRERCTHYRPIHDKYHSKNLPVPGCPWCQKPDQP